MTALREGAASPRRAPQVPQVPKAELTGDELYRCAQKTSVSTLINQAVIRSYLRHARMVYERAS
jgi:hypothetical protein